MMWRVLANGQNLMGRECLEMAREAKTVEDVRQCVDLANKCAMIESACAEMAKREAGGCRRCLGAGGWPFRCPDCGWQGRGPAS